MADIFSEYILPALAVIIPALITLGARWVAKQKWASDGVKDFTVALEGITQRSVDRYNVLLKQARSPDSDGGVEVTDEEREEILEEMKDLLLDQLKGAGKEYALRIGGEAIKGLISRYLPDLWDTEEDGDEE